MTKNERLRRIGAILRECLSERNSLDRKVKELEKENRRLRALEAECVLLRELVKSRLA